MIKKITLAKTASYKEPTCLETNKQVNLVYGLNGTGKSTLSNFLYSPKSKEFQNCSIDGLSENEDLLVYNQKFIQENFFESENQKGIFSLSKENKQAKIKILQATTEREKLREKINATQQQLKEYQDSHSKDTSTAKNKIWEIKTYYSGGSRVLEYCLGGLKNSKENLFNYIISCKKPTEEPSYNIESLRNELQKISEENAQKYETIPQIKFTSQHIEKEPLFQKKIVGNENSSISELIKKLGNSDWVKQGLSYLPAHNHETNICPFCQQQTISEPLLTEIKNYFDESYETDIQLLQRFSDNYSQAVSTIPEKESFAVAPIFEEYQEEFGNTYDIFMNIVESNQNSIKEKLKTPSSPTKLKNSTEQLHKINKLIDLINDEIRKHNHNIDQKETVKANIKKKFWQLMRWNYDTTLTEYLIRNKEFNKKENQLNQEIETIRTYIEEQNNLIVNEQKKTVNIAQAITNINKGLIELGITDLQIKNQSEGMYKIIRDETDNNIFHSLSEGEKMVISFLYFLELCRGRKTADDIDKKKIIVIDDPISSLSHIYVFNVSQLIKNEFFSKDSRKRYDQIFILTHSLYFFYELVEKQSEKREEKQGLFRLIKNHDGSKFNTLKYKEIQNDYQAYWSIVKDSSQPVTLIANCMRNIIEYFFSFIEKNDLNNLFQKPELQGTKYQAFHRYINRESHSDGQNIIDFKEFNYNDFEDAFQTLFKIAGYEKHYNKMMK